MNDDLSLRQRGSAVYSLGRKKILGESKGKSALVCLPYVISKKQQQHNHENITHS